MTDGPNLLLFVPDGFQGRIVDSADSLTPAIDAVADRGVRLSNCHTPLPTCSPARASMMTGVYPHNHGVLQVEHVVNEDQSVLRESYPHWPTLFAENGYATAYFGKWHIERSNDLKRFGWRVNRCDSVSAFRAIGAGVEETGRLLEGAGPQRFHHGPPGYRDVLHYAVTPVDTDERRFARIASEAIEYVREAARRDRPWACMVSFSEPNTPLVAGRAAYDRYDADAIELPVSFGDRFENGPGFYRRQAEIFSHLAEREWRELRACYMALVTELDAQLARIVAALDETGQTDRTIIIVTGDHGRYVGAHGLDAHNFGAYEEIYTVPFVACGPAVAEGAVSDAHVSLVDLFPTVLDLVGIEHRGRPEIDGRSFADLLADPIGAAGNHTRSMAEYHGTRYLMSQRVLWEGRYKLVFNGFDYDELYDLAEDPHELRNLVGDPGFASIHHRLMRSLWDELARTGDTTLLETHYPPMRFGVVGPVRSANGGGVG